MAEAVTRHYLLIGGVAVALYLPTGGFGFVQDDRAIIAANPAAHSVPAAIRAFDDPYWPRESGGRLYRPVTVLSHAVDWTLFGGRPGWMHVVNALWHGVVTVLVMVVVARWLPPLGVAAAGLVFAVHPVHVEAVAGLVSRAELLAAAGMLGAVLAARRQQWGIAVACAAVAMLSKEHGVVTSVAILLDDWLESRGGPRYPKRLYAALGAATAAFVALWLAIGRSPLGHAAAAFIGADTGQRLAVALPAVWRALLLLLWPVDLSADYGPQVIPARDGFSVHAFLGFLVVLGIAAGVWFARRLPALAFAAGIAALAYLPTSNLLFPSGVVLAERALYVPVVLPAVGVGLVALSASDRLRRPLAIVLVGALCALLAWRSYTRLPVWRDNKKIGRAHV